LIVNKPQFDVGVIKRGDALVVKMEIEEPKYPYNMKTVAVNCLVKAATPLKLILVTMTLEGDGEAQKIITIEEVVNGTYKIFSMEVGMIWSL
jgi:hypothetical protein